MNDYDYISATEVRNNFSDTLNGAVYIKPQIIKRNSNYALLMSQKQVFDLLDQMKLHAIIEKDSDGSFLATCKEIEDLHGTGKTKEDALNDLSAYLDIYAHEFYAHYESFVNSNRKAHLPYIFKVMTASSDYELKDMFVCQDGKN